MFRHKELFFLFYIRHKLRKCVQYFNCHILLYFTLSINYASTSWASDAISERRNQTYTDRTAEVCLVA